jgi:hypothetical protein
MIDFSGEVTEHGNVRSWPDCEEMLPTENTVKQYVHWRR